MSKKTDTKDAETSASTESSKPKPGAENQQQRWLKYGSLLVLSCVVALVLATLLTYLTQRAAVRLDTTATGTLSLSPQTVGIINKNETPIKIVSVYTRSRPEGAEFDRYADVDFVTPVNDLIEEYARKGKNIEVELIDRDQQKQKVDDLIKLVTETFDAEVKAYREIAEAYPELYHEISKLAEEEAKRFADLPMSEEEFGDRLQEFIMIAATVKGVPSVMQDSQRAIQRELGRKPARYRRAIELMREGLEGQVELIGALLANLGDVAKDPDVPASFKAYIEKSSPNFAKMRDLSSKFVERIEALKEAKIDELAPTLQRHNPVIVLGPNNVKVISFSEMWHIDQRDLDRSEAMQGKQIKVRPRFAGEEQITSAILEVSADEKPMVAFIRVANPRARDMPMSQADMAVFANQLRRYNYNVVDKDISGMAAMQAQMRGFPFEEPSDEELAKAVWVVLAVPGGGPAMGPGMPPTPSIEPRLRAHLENGGSALIIGFPGCDRLLNTLDPWGITIHANELVVHDPPTKEPVGLIELLTQQQHLFLTSAFGDHPITKPVKDLPGLLVNSTRVTTKQADGVTSTPLLPFPDIPNSWAFDTTASASRGLEFDMEKDVAGKALGGNTLYAGAAAEKEGKGRVVVIGTPMFINDLLMMADPELAEQTGIVQPAFPANAEILSNSVHWLSKRESLIALSPQSYRQPRIQAMSDTELGVWRIGVVLIAMPAVVLMGGVVMWMRRRD